MRGHKVNFPESLNATTIHINHQQPLMVFCLSAMNDSVLLKNSIQTSIKNVYMYKSWIHFPESLQPSQTNYNTQRQYKTETGDMVIFTCNAFSSIFCVCYRRNCWNQLQIGTLLISEKGENMFSNAPRSVTAIIPILSTSTHNHKEVLALQTSARQYSCSVAKDSI